MTTSEQSTSPKLWCRRTFIESEILKCLFKTRTEENPEVLPCEKFHFTSTANEMQTLPNIVSTYILGFKKF